MNPKLSSFLSRVINSELHAIVLYLQTSFNLKGLEMASVSDTFKEYAEGEMGHLGKWSQFYTALGGILQLPALNVPAPTTLEEALRLAIKAEEEGIALYIEGRQLGEELGYIALTVECENILVEEEDHRQTWTKILAGIIPAGGEDPD